MPKAKDGPLPGENDPRRYLPIPIARKTRSDQWEPTNKDIEFLRHCAAICVPLEVMAALLDISKRTLVRASKRDERISAALIKGRAETSLMLHAKAFEMAMAVGVRAPDALGQPTGRYLHDQDICTRMLIFCLKAREGWIEAREPVKDDGVSTDKKVTEGNVGVLRSKARELNKRK